MSQKEFQDEHLDRVETNQSVQETPAHFEKMFLAPENKVKGELRKTFGNPTPVALAGFLLCNTAACCDLMGWRGAGGGSGNASASTGAYFFLGAVLLYAGAIGEWILGNTFPSVVFFTFGGFWGTFGATLTSSFDAISNYGTDSAAFDASFAFFLIFMGLLCLVYLVASIRTNLCLFGILFCFVLTFPLLSASYWYGAEGRATTSANCRIAGGAFGFIASMIAWYLWASQVFESVDLPFRLPVGDLSSRVKGRADRLRHMA